MSDKHEKSSSYGPVASFLSTLHSTHNIVIIVLTFHVRRFLVSRGSRSNIKALHFLVNRFVPKEADTVSVC